MNFFSGDKIKEKIQEESISSIQLDFLSASKFDLYFVDKNQEKCRPYIIHRAPLGSHERFIAMMLEYFDGHLPFRFCPIQYYILPLNEKASLKAQELLEKGKKRGLRIEVGNEKHSLSVQKKLIYKLRPFYYLVIGDEELNSDNCQLMRNNQEIQHQRLSELFNSFD